MSVPTNHIVAQQNIASSQTQSHYVSSGSSQGLLIPHEVLHPRLNSLPEQIQQPSYRQLTSSGGESSSNVTLRGGAASSSPPLQPPMPPPQLGPSQAPHGLPEMSQSMHLDTPMLGPHSDGGVHSVLSPHATPQAPPHANQFVDIQTFNSLGDSECDPALPFADSQFVSGLRKCRGFGLDVFATRISVRSTLQHRLETKGRYD